MKFYNSLIAEKMIHLIEKTDISSLARTEKRLTAFQLKENDFQHLTEVFDFLTTNKQDLLMRTMESTHYFFEDNANHDKLAAAFTDYCSYFPYDGLDKTYFRHRKKIGQTLFTLQYPSDLHLSFYLRMVELLFPYLTLKYRNKPSKLNTKLLSSLKFFLFDFQLTFKFTEEDRNLEVIEHLNHIIENFIEENKLATLLKSISVTKQEAYDVSSSTEELSSTVTDISNHAHLVAANTEKTNKDIRKGQETIENSLNSFLLMASDFIEARNKIQDLLAEIDNIHQVVDFIQSIAEQTDLLSLNAAIESSTDFGDVKGFSVVADEIRRLADKTSTSAAKIASIITNLHFYAEQAETLTQKVNDQINERVDQAKNALTTLDHIVNQVELIGHSTNDIAVLTEQQTLSTEKILAHVENIIVHVNNIEGNSNYTGESIYKTSKNINELRKKTTALIPELRPRQILTIFGHEHFFIHWNLYNVFLGYSTHGEFETQYLAHSTLEEWFEHNKRASKLATLPSFPRMEQIHKEFHKEVQGIFQKLQDKRESEVSFSRLDSLLMNITQIIDSLKDEWEQ